MTDTSVSRLLALKHNLSTTLNINRRYDIRSIYDRVGRGIVATANLHTRGYRLGDAISLYDLICIAEVYENKWFETQNIRYYLTTTEWIDRINNMREIIDIEKEKD